MKKLSKRKNKNKMLIKNADNSSLHKSISLLKRITSGRFNETFEAHINLNTTSLKSNFSRMITLPHIEEKKKRVLILTTSKFTIKPKDIGTELSISETLSNNMIKKINDFDKIIATPEMIPKIVPFKQVLGTKGLLPSIKEGTLVNINNLSKSIQEFKEGKFKYNIDKTGNIHIRFGKMSFTETQLVENLVFLYSFLKKSNTFNTKRVLFKSIYICTTMSPSIKLNLNLFT